MRPDGTSVDAAIRLIPDPELDRPLEKLGMVSSVDVERKKVRVLISLPGPGYPTRARDELVGAIEKRVSQITGNGKAEVTFELQSDADQKRTADFLVADVPFQVSDPKSNCRVIGVTSGKGGVGKSSVAVNLAMALRQAGSSVGILDADVYGFSVPKMLGIETKPMAVDRLVIPPRSNGVRCLSMGFFVGDDQPVIWRGPMLHKALEQFLKEAWWDVLDYLVVDMPPGTGDVAMSMAGYVPHMEILVVTTPQPAAQRVAQRSAYAAKKLKLAVRGVVENMSWFRGDDGKSYELFGAGGGGELAKSLGVPLMAQVPLVPMLREGGDIGAPITVADPDSEASIKFAELAESLQSMGSTRRYRPELVIKSN